MKNIKARKKNATDTETRHIGSGKQAGELSTKEEILNCNRQEKEAGGENTASSEAGSNAGI